MAYITRIQIDQCRNVRQLDIDLSVPADENGANGSAAPARPKFRHLILTGPNGSGKSGVLEELAAHVDAALYPDPARPMLPVVITSWIPEPELWKDSHGRGLGLGALTAWREIGSMLASAGAQGEMIAAYLPARRRMQPQKVAGPSKLDWGPKSLTTSTEAAAKLLQFLVNKRMEQALAAEDQDSAAVERTRDWFSAFEGHLRRLTEDEGLSLDFDRRAFNFRFRRGDGYTFDINTLADGHAAVLAILAELLIRVDVIREARKDYAFVPEGVVIVDEIETHLHLSLQEKILPFLTELFPTLQFIVATHSPAVIASIPNAVVVDLLTREPVLSDHFRGIRYGMLMTEHFGISSEIDLDSTRKLLRLRDLAGRATRAANEEKELSDLSALLTSRSPSMAVEVWMVKERLGYASPAEAKK